MCVNRSTPSGHLLGLENYLHCPISLDSLKDVVQIALFLSALTVPTPTHGAPGVLHTRFFMAISTLGVASLSWKVSHLGAEAVTVLLASLVPGTLGAQGWHSQNA